MVVTVKVELTCKVVTVKCASAYKCGRCAGHKMCNKVDDKRKT